MSMELPSSLRARPSPGAPPPPAVAASAGPPGVMPVRCEVRYLPPSADLAEVMAIERAAHVLPWSELQLRGVLALRNVIGLVGLTYAGGREHLSGFVLYEMRPRDLVILDFAVHPDRRRRGVGRAMARALKAKLCPVKRPRLEVRVNETNLAAQLFWAAMGFKAVAVERGYFGVDDGFHFRYRVADDGRGPWAAGGGLDTGCGPGGAGEGGS